MADDQSPAPVISDPLKSRVLFIQSKARLAYEQRNIRREISTQNLVLETLPISIDKSCLEKYCLRYHIRRLALFGSVLRDDFSQDSDVDVLVEFQADHIPGWEIVTLADELSSLFGRTVDLRTSMDISRYFRQEVEWEAIAIYEQG